MEPESGTQASSSPKERTFQFDPDLPPLPVPELQDTLKKYLDSVKPLTTEDEYKETERIVGEFGQGLGQTLHNKLLERAKARRNWLEDWWLEKAYLTNRTPLGVCSMVGANRAIEDVWPPCLGTDVERAAICTWYLLKYHDELRKETIPVSKSKSGDMIFSMSQLRYLFNGSREPGIECDKLLQYFKTDREGHCPTHLTVTCNGHIFRLDPFDKRGRLMNAKEIARQFEYIKAHSVHRGQCVPSLTADDRTSYAEIYQHIKKLDAVNVENLHIIDTSIALIAFDKATPQNYNELLQEVMTGNDPENHWWDKSYILVIYANGTLSCMSEHAPYDGIVSMEMTYWGYQRMQKNGGTWPEPDCVIREDLPLPTELVFTIDRQVQDAIKKATDTYHRHADNVEILCSRFRNYGKEWCKKLRVHPDIVCQLSIQLAYYKMYGKPAPTYETATTRQFYNGRTETCRSCTSESLAWCQAMVDPLASNALKADLLKAAYTKHGSLMMDSLENRGCDRHLLGLYCISDELGLPIPEIFMDAGFQKSGGGGNYILSTSLAGYAPFIGLVPPMCQDGYFVSYRIASDQFEFCVVRFRNSTETDNHAFFKLITQSMIDIQNVAVSATAKL